jgi:hypothetical protein
MRSCFHAPNEANGDNITDKLVFDVTDDRKDAGRSFTKKPEPFAAKRTLLSWMGIYAGHHQIWKGVVWSASNQ